MDDVERPAEAGTVPSEDFELWLREQPPRPDGERGMRVPVPRSGRAARTVWPKAWQPEPEDADREDRRHREDRLNP